MKWSLNADEVGFGYNASSGGGTFERKTKITSRRLCMQHLPTKIMVEREIPPGHYSKKEMQKLTEEIKKQLFIELEQKVAKHLRIPGR